VPLHPFRFAETYNLAIENMTMNALVALLLFMAALAGFLELLNWRDRLRARALMLEASINATVSRQLKGESLVSVEVLLGAPWRAGRVILSAPRGGPVVESVLAPVLRIIPEDYELVVRAA
jgi:hypothetical protein